MVSLKTRNKGQMCVNRLLKVSLSMSHLNPVQTSLVTVVLVSFCQVLPYLQDKRPSAAWLLLLFCFLNLMRLGEC